MMIQKLFRGWHGRLVALFAILMLLASFGMTTMAMGEEICITGIPVYTDGANGYIDFGEVIFPDTGLTATITDTSIGFTGSVTVFSIEFFDGDSNASEIIELGGVESASGINPNTYTSISSVEFCVEASDVYVPNPTTTVGIFPDFDPSPAGNAVVECGRYGYDYGIKMDGIIQQDGVYTASDFGVTITVVGNSSTFDNVTVFDWSAVYTSTGLEAGIDLVLAKAGPGYNVYDYSSFNPEIKADTGLEFFQGKQLSHITFCFDFEVVVQKDVTTRFTRTYEWRIDKYVDTPINQFVNESTDTTWYVDVYQTGYSDGAFGASGEIVIYNPHPTDAAQIASVVDTLTGTSIPTDATVTCPDGASFSIPALTSVTCTYNAPLPDAGYDLNTAVVTVTEDSSVDGGEGTADVTWDAPVITYADDVVNVEDPEAGDGVFSAIEAQDVDSEVLRGEFSYVINYDCDAEDGSGYDVPNTAILVGNTNGTIDEDTATLRVNCYEVTVAKNGLALFTRTFNWDVDKTINGEPISDLIELFNGESEVATWEIIVEQLGYTDSDHYIAGAITVTNSTPLSATISDVSDIYQGIEVENITCDLPLPTTLAPNAVLTCLYTLDLDEPLNGNNTATAARVNNDYDVDGVATPQADPTLVDSAAFTITFGNPTTLVNDEVIVTDDYAPADLLTAIQADLTAAQNESVFSEPFTYEITYSCDANEGQYINLAELFDYDSESDTTGVELAEDDATLDVDCYEVTVTKDGDAFFTRTFNWDVDKTINGEPISDLIELFNGESEVATWEIIVEQLGYTDSNWYVSGNISVINSTPLSATISAVTDIYQGNEADVTCEVDLPTTLASGETLNCSYTVDLLSAISGNNIANAARVNNDYDADGNPTPQVDPTLVDSVPYPITFGEPTTYVNDEVIVTDDYAPADLLTAIQADLSAGENEPVLGGTFTYEITYSCGEDAGQYINLAELFDYDSGSDTTGEELAEDDATLDVDCYGLTVSKDVTTEFDRTWEWMIDKELTSNFDPNPDGSDVPYLFLSQGQEYTASYLLTVTGTPIDSGHIVYGDVTIVNSSPLVAVIDPANVTDNMGGINVPVSCPLTDGMVVVAANNQVVCTYSYSNADVLDTDYSATNTASVSMFDVTYSSEAEAVAFDDLNPTNETYESYSVSDTLVDFLGEDQIFDAVYSGGGQVFVTTITYTYVVDTSACGPEYQLINTATVTAQDDELGAGDTDDDTVVVDVNIPCNDVCTLTQGYWKTHSKFGPASGTAEAGYPRYDDNWDDVPTDPYNFDGSGDTSVISGLGENTPFFDSGYTWISIMFVPPQGDGYIQLAHQYVAAYLNYLNGAPITDEVEAALNDAYGILSTNLPDGSLKGRNARAARNAASTLDAYNNGLLTGDCTEDGDDS